MTNKEKKVPIDQQRKAWEAFLSTDTGMRHIQRMSQQLDHLALQADKAQTPNEAFALIKERRGVRRELEVIERIISPEPPKTRATMFKEWRQRLLDS